MNKRVIGPISVCLTVAGLALARGEAPAPFPLPETNSPTAARFQTPPAAPDDKLKPVPTEKGNEGGQVQPPNSLTAPRVGAASTEGMSGPAAGVAQRPKVDLKDDHIGPVERFWARGEYLFWWTKTGPLPVPLAATGPVDPLALPSTILLGNGDLDYKGRSGGRVTAGVWLDDLHHLGFEGGGFLLERPTLHQTVSSNASGFPVLARPILGTEIVGMNGVPAAVPFAFPGVLSGSLTVSSASRFWGAEANFTRNLIDEANWTFNLSFGFRYLSLDENLFIDQTANVLAPLFPLGIPNPVSTIPGSTLAVSDGFSTQNNFYGAQIGGRVGWRKSIWTVDVDTRVAFGPNHEALNVSGTTRLTQPGLGTQNLTGGLLALAPNIGHQSTNWFVVVPEVGAQVGCQLTRHIKIQAGYNFLYINSVIRPGDQVNPNVNRTLLPTSTVQFGPREPAPLFRQTDFWAHGITAGVTFTY